jgi:hypothetical protein
MSESGWDNSYPVKYKCTFCNSYFKTEKEMNDHKEEKHSDF